MRIGNWAKGKPRPPTKCNAGLQQANPKPDLHGREVLVPEALAVTKLMDTKKQAKVAR